MSKERELLELLKQSNAADSASGMSSAAEVVQGSTSQSAGEAVMSSSWDSSAMMNMLVDVSSSMIADPLFYLKAFVVVIVALTILTYAADFIFGG